VGQARPGGEGRARDLALSAQSVLDLTGRGTYTRHVMTQDEGSATKVSTMRRGQRLKVAGLFAGIGGIEQGLRLAGHESILLCEIDPNAQRVLETHFPDTPVVPDVRKLRNLPDVDVVAAGFPCQDLSQAGRTAGITGRNSGLVTEVFRIIARSASPRWLLLENVPFMLQLDRGRAMRVLVNQLEHMGFTWAYRIVDTRAFGLPQRRLRVVMVASRTEDPRAVLFEGDEKEPLAQDPHEVACGFYWTEGLRGLGWAVDAVPTLKGGSTVGIPSPPAIRLATTRRVVTPDIRDAERLQGFPADWTRVGSDAPKAGIRWKLVGNAVSVPVARWIGERLSNPTEYDHSTDRPLNGREPWPKAAWGRSGRSFSVERSSWPVREEYQSLEPFLRYPPVPLSARATAGFLARAEMSNLRFLPSFLRDVRLHLRQIRRGH
jgi:DNA (cytosine-5)-methyltransferase 1